MYQLTHLKKTGHGKIYFVYLPEFSRYTSNISSDNYRNKHEVIDLIRSLDIPVIDIHEELFSKYEDPLSFFPFSKKGHYTARTDKKIAEIIVSRIGSWMYLHGGEGGIRTLEGF